LKITAIRPAGLRHGTPQGGWSNEIRPEDCVHTLIAVFTDEGITGWGSAFTNDELVRGALHVLAPLYLGENPLEPERVSEKLHANTFWMGRGGSVTHAISGIDIAMWDILGKVTGQPVGRLLEDAIANGCGLCVLLMREPEALAEHLCAVHSQGFRAFKIGWGPLAGTASRRTRKSFARRATPWDRMPAHGGRGRERRLLPQDYKWATRTARMLAEYDVHWFEEPLPPDNLHDYVLLRNRSPVPIAGGEVLTRRQSFTPWLQQRAFDIVQPDVTKVGGISEERRIAWMAEENGVRFIPHGWNTALGWPRICIWRRPAGIRMWWSI